MPRWILRHLCSDEPYICCPHCGAPLCFVRDHSRRGADANGRIYYDFDLVYVANLDPWTLDHDQCWCGFAVGESVDGLLRLQFFRQMQGQFPDGGFFDGGHRELRNEFVFNRAGGYDPCCVWKCGVCHRQLFDYPHFPNEYTKVVDLVNVFVNNDCFYCRCGQLLGRKGNIFVYFVPTANVIKAYPLSIE